jgi:hypothetical protein
MSEPAAQAALFPEPEQAPIRFCGIAMGGYGEWDCIPEDQAAVTVIVPASMVSGQSINSLNSPAWRYQFAVQLFRIRGTP